MNTIDIAYAMTAPAEAIAFFLMFGTFFEKRRAFAFWQYAAGFVVFSILIRVINASQMFRVGNVAGVILSALIVSCIFYKASLSKRLFTSFFTWIVLVTMEMVVLNGMMVLLGITVNEAIGTPAYLILGVVLSKGLGLGVCYAISKKMQSGKMELGVTYWMAFVFLFAVSVTASFLIFWMLRILDDPDYNIMGLLCSVGLFGATFLSLYLYERSLRQNRMLRIREKADLQLKSQIKHMDEIILKQNEIRRMRHDMNNQLVALKGYIDAGDFEGSARYLASLSDQLAQTNPAINTGNNALDAVLGAKQAVAEDRGIAFQCRLRIQENLPIAPQDLCVIFGNALDNAIEACDRLPEECEKRISLTFLQDAHSLSCNIENTAAPNRPRTLATSKADKENHGFGLQNITETLAKYDSTPIITQSDGSFSLGFVIFLRG